MAQPSARSPRSRGAAQSAPARGRAGSQPVRRQPAVRTSQDAMRKAMFVLGLFLIVIAIVATFYA